MCPSLLKFTFVPPIRLVPIPIFLSASFTLHHHTRRFRLSLSLSLSLCRSFSISTSSNTTIAFEETRLHTYTSNYATAVCELVVEPKTVECAQYHEKFIQIKRMCCAQAISNAACTFGPPPTPSLPTIRRNGKCGHLNWWRNNSTNKTKQKTGDILAHS